MNNQPETAVIFKFAEKSKTKLALKNRKQLLTKSYKKSISQMNTMHVSSPSEEETMPGPSSSSSIHPSDVDLPQTYRLTWNKHQENLVEVFDGLMRMERYVDCTIVVEKDVVFKAHRVILAASSRYFETVLKNLPMDHCTIVVPGVQSFEMSTLLEFMYTGEINVTREQFPKIIEIARQFEIKGLFEMDKKCTNISNSSSSNYNYDTITSSQHQAPDSLSSSIIDDNCRISNHQAAAAAAIAAAAAAAAASKIITPTSPTNAFDNNYKKQDRTNISSSSMSDDKFQHPLSEHQHHHLHHQQQQQQPQEQHYHHQQQQPMYHQQHDEHEQQHQQQQQQQQQQQHVNYERRWSTSSIAAAAMLGSVYDSVRDNNPLKRKKVSSINSMLMNCDSSILQNVLSQSHSDAAATIQPIALLNQIKTENLTSSNGQSSPNQEIVSSEISNINNNNNNSSNNNNNSCNGSDYNNEKKFKFQKESHSPFTERSFEDDGPDCSTNYSGNGSLNNYGSQSQQKPEWKRYKQYTRADITSAIQCVKEGMSALQASRKFNVPSRTLYDKVKKMNINTGRPINRAQRRNTTSGRNSSAAFPYSSFKDELRECSTEHCLPQSMPHPAVALLDLKQAFETHEAGRGALQAMAMAAVAHAAMSSIKSPSQTSSSHHRSPSPNSFNRKTILPESSTVPNIRDHDILVERERQRLAIRDENHERDSNDFREQYHQGRQHDEELDHVEDLSIARKKNYHNDESIYAHRSPSSYSLSSPPAAPPLPQPSSSSSSNIMESSVIVPLAAAATTTAPTATNKMSLHRDDNNKTSECGMNLMKQETTVDIGGNTDECERQCN